MVTSWTRNRGLPRPEPPYRIVFASPIWYRGGLEVVTCTHLKLLPRDLWQPILLVGHVDGMEFPPDCEVHVNETCFEWPPKAESPAKVKAAREASKTVLHKLQPDVVVGQLCNGLLWAANDLGIPCIAEYWHCGWGRDANEHPSDFIVSVSNATTEKCTKTFGRQPRVPVHVIYNGLEEGVWKFVSGRPDYDPGRHWGSRETIRDNCCKVYSRQQIMGFVGRISSEKDPLSWLDVLAKVQATLGKVENDEVAPHTAQVPRVVGMVCGAVWDQETYRQVVDRCRLRGMDWSQIRHVLCAYDRMPGYYSAMDVLVHCRQDEPFGMIVPESLSCGTPVVAFDAAGIHEIGEVLGYPEALHLVRPGDLDAMTREVLAVLESGERCDNLRPSVLEHFGAQRMSDQFQGLLLRQLHGG